MRGISTALAVVVAATTVLKNDEMLLARETFSGLQTMLANNQQLTIVEVVDDFEESSMGYLIGGMEPYNVEQAKQNGTMDDLIDELLTKGLLTTGNTDDWNSYPLRYEVIDTVYSDYGEDEAILNEGFRQQGETESELGGYYVPIEISGDERAFYRCSINNYQAMQTMTLSGLREAAEKIKNSYAPYNNYEEGYPAETGYQYFRFVVGDPKDAVAVLSISDRSVPACAVTAGITAAASPDDAAADSEQLSDDDAEDFSESVDDGVSADYGQPIDGDAVPADLRQPDDDVTAPSYDDASLYDVLSPDGNTVRSDDRSAAPAEIAPPSNETVQTDSNLTQQEEPEPAAQPGNEAADQNETDSASAVIYVEFDKDNTILVASLGTAGVGDILDADQSSGEAQRGAAAPAQGSAAAGIGNGAIPTVTPAPTPAQAQGAASPAAQEDDGSDKGSSNDGADTSAPGGTTAHGDNPEAENSDNTVTPTPGDGSDRADSNGSGERGSDGDDADNGDADGDDTDDENTDGEDDEDDKNTDGEDDEQDPSDEEDLDEDGDDRTDYLVTFEWDGLDSEKGDFTEPALPAEETVKDGDEITIPAEPDAFDVRDSEGNTIGAYTFEGWKIGAAGADTYASVGAGDSVSVTEDMTVIGTWSYQEGACYTVSYQWVLTEEQDGSLPSGVSADTIVLKSQIQTFGMSSQPEITLPPKESVAEGTPYVVNDDYMEGDVYDAYDADGNYIGTCTFGGWKDSDGAACEGEIVLDGDTLIFGALSFRAAGGITYEFKFPWSGDCLIEDGKALKEGTELNGVSDDDERRTIRITLKDGARLEKAIVVPDPQTVSGTTCYVNGEYREGAEIIVSEKRTINHGVVWIEVGRLVFSGWKENLTDTDPIDPRDSYEVNGDVTLRGEWEFVSRYSLSCKVNYEWGLETSTDDGDWSTETHNFPGTVNGAIRTLGSGTELPNGVKLNNGGYLDGNPELPTEDYSWYQGMSYTPAADYTEGMELCIYESVDGSDELVGTYTFLGWEIHLDGSDEARMLTANEQRSGFELKGDTTLRGVWDYIPEATADLIVGSGYAYVYIKDEIHNNDWFRYYVMGLEEKDFGRVNVRLVTYLADGSDKRAYGYKAAEDCPTLTEAFRKADLVYLNTDGTDAGGNRVASGQRLSAENAKMLLERACNVDRSARLAVILDGSVRNNSVDENIKKVRTILLQTDIAEAYQSLGEDSISYETAYTAEGWQILAAKADEAVKNNGNFVHDNIYCVSDRRTEFRNTTYTEELLTYIDREKMPALANADFENRFTDSATDGGFAEVYQAIQKENYERSRNGGQASIDEYVMPAMAVAYILNYRDYDPIIYKDKIRVLELQPCRDYTYYYDEKDHPTQEGELERKRQFAIDWAPDFLDKLDADPDAITIDGMTTSEFCGKIMDIYEEYDVIYFGANNGILHHQSDGGGLRWTQVSAYNGTVSRKDRNNDRILYTYHDGNWYKSEAENAQKRWVELPGGPGIIVEDWLWKWDPSTRKWIKKQDWGDGNTPGWDMTSGDYRYDSQTGKWYENRYDFGAETLCPGGPGEEFFVDGTNVNDSTWRWRVAGGEWVNNEYVTHETGWYHKVYAEPVTYTTYNDAGMDGMLYTHVGDKMTAAYNNYEGHLVNEGAYGFRSSGNDILGTQVGELLDYLNGGSLIILSSDFMTENENGKYVINSSEITHPTSRGATHGILDTSSYVYQFVRGCFERKADGSDVPKYSNLIVEDYGNGDLRDTEAFTEALNQQKVTLNLYAMPKQYGYQECFVSGTTGTVTNQWNGQQETYTRNYSHDVSRIDEDTRLMLQKEADGKYYLNYEFIIGNLSAVAPLTTRYHVQLFLDSNSDGIYNTASEELEDITVINAQTGAVLEREGGKYQLQMNIPYRVRRELPDGYVGCIGWKLTVTQNGNEHIHDSVTGLTAVAVQPGYSDEVNPATGKKIIHVLQITPSLYGNPMDLEIQTDLSNAYGGNGNFDEEWYELLTNLPDFEIDFDSIYYWDFAHSFLRPGEAHYEAQYDNGGVDGKLTGPYGRNDYLNLYQYDMVIVGFCDMVPSIPSQRAVEALLRYADMGKSMLFTHDTTYSGWENGSPSNFAFAGGLGQPFSMSIRDLCGMDRYGVSVDWYRYDGETAQDNRDGSPIRTPGAQANAYNGSSAAYQWYASHPGGNSRDVAYAPGTNQTMMAAQTQGLTWCMTGQAYQGMFNWQSHGKITAARGNRDTIDPADTNTVTRVNGGIITQYPYDIPEQIEVGDTHAQYYQLDLDTDWEGDGRGDVVCWYAISSLDDGDWNDIYDFSPNDVRNNYYIYNKGNITYTGVGHSTDHITLDEKKLFINTFVAAYSAGIRNPSVRIVEDGSVNAPDLENVSIPFNGVDEATAGTYRVYYQVKDNNITQGTRNLSVKYYIGNPAGGDTVIYRTQTGSETIPANLFADGVLTTYSADTGLPVEYDEVRSGHSYYVDVPLNRLLDNEKFDFYVEVDLTMADDPSHVAAFDVDKLTIAKLKMFSLD